MSTHSFEAASLESIRDTLRGAIATALRLPREDVDVDIPFLEMGASSLALIDALRAVYDRYGVRPSVRKVFEKYNTVDLLTAYVCELLEAKHASEAAGGAGAPAAAPLPGSGVVERVPLTEAQRHAWFLARYSKGASTAQNETVILKLSGRLNLPALREAFQGVVRRHEALRARMLFDEDAQHITDEDAPPLACVDVAAADAGRWIAEETRRPFDLERPLARASVLRLSDEEHLIVLSAHGLIADRRSLHLAVSEMGAIYTADLQGVNASLEPVMPLRDYSEALMRHEQAPEYQRAAAYWSEHYSDGIPQIDLPSTHPRPAIKSYEGSRLVLPLEPALLRGLEAWSAQHGSTIFMTLLGAFNIFVHRLTGEDDMVVGIFGRGAPLLTGGERLIANASNAIPLRMQVDAGMTFPACVESLRKGLLDALDHQDVPFASLIRTLSPRRDQSRSPIFTFAFDIEPPLSSPQFQGLAAAWMTPPTQHARYDLQLTVVEAGSTFQLQCDYSTDLFDAPTMRRFVRNFKVLLEGIVASPDALVSALPVLSAAERTQIVDEWNQTRTDYPRDRCVHQLFEEQAKRTPEAVAVVFEDRSLTYAQLNRRANQIANRLRRMGVGPESCVGVCALRSLEVIVAFLAVIKAGGAYMPLDPTYPRERLALMVNETGAPVVLAQDKLVDRVTGLGPEVLALDSEVDAFAGESEEDPPNLTTSRNLVYVIYTSGSTGRPKGVRVEHRGVVRLVMNTNFVELSPRDVMLQFCAFTFDVATFEIWGALLHGAQLVMGPAHMPSLEELAQLIARSGVTVAWLTSGLFHQMVDNQLHNLTRVRQFLAGGDVLSPPHVRRVLELPGERRMINGYGPTENTTFTACYVMTDPSQVGSSVSIGRPIANSTIYILDANLEPVPIGVPGELLTGGDGVARGYLGQPELTAERFIKDPFSAEEDARLYRTGDLARFLPDGTIEFLGRTDRQVKIRGYRIELEEVEVVLGRHPGVQSVTVIVREDVPGDKRLVAYLVPRATPAPTVLELRGFLAESIPPYMIPSAFVILDALPLTSAGKVNRRALPAPDEGNRAQLARAYTPPETPMQEVLARIWADALGVERVGIHDDFFDLGGHSLLLTPLLLRVRQFFQVKLALSDFFASPTIAAMARLIADAHQTETSQPRSSLHDPDGNVAQARFQMLDRDAELEEALRPTGPTVALQPFKRMLMTGATGYVGTHILRNLLDSTDQDVRCLIRSKTPEEGKQKLLRRLAGMDLLRETDAARIIPVSGDVSLPRFGLDDQAYKELAGTADAVLHCAAFVNFIYPYEALKKTNVDGMREVIRFAFEVQTKPLHFVSSTGIWPMGRHRAFTEETSIDHGVLLNLGYDESKWVQEKMLMQAQARGLPAIIYRPGEVSGHSETGRINADEHFAFALLKGCLQLKAFPPINCFIDLSPVDYVGQVIAHIAQQPERLGGVFHITNPGPMHSTEVFAWFQSRGYTFDVISVEEWLARLLGSEDFMRNALYPYMALLEEFREENFQLPKYECHRTVEAMHGSGLGCPPVDGRLLGRYTDFLVSTGFLPTPSSGAAQDQGGET